MNSTRRRETDHIFSSMPFKVEVSLPACRSGRVSFQGDNFLHILRLLRLPHKQFNVTDSKNVYATARIRILKIGTKAPYRQELSMRSRKVPSKETRLQNVRTA
ncbi:hypothetical protein CEXT_117141 [Caerostris extrusa]|uniref:Uncharacterized protein n=1 Tax=Caerostris extrusa TaxID=172846 RepID=A0AAV4UT36_CAEEX|nr:hypothetical protein CEXT_117141 [Caerostris extrusa]